MKVKQHSAEHVTGTSTELTQRQIIRDNVATWRRERRNRQERQEHRDQQSRAKKFENKGLATVAEAFVGKRVFV